MRTPGAASRALELLLLGASLVACGGASQQPAQPTRERPSAADLGRCDLDTPAGDHPFVFAWDGAALASFEAHAAREIVIVRRAGCTLEVLDFCADPRVPGRFGAYRPPTWTSGTLQLLEIRTEEELHAKLPLGAAALSGLPLRIEYFVAGVTTATRDALDARDLAELPGCVGATHFVWGYELGAFRSSSGSTGLARAGDLASCTGAGTELHTCRAPVRLTLRAIIPRAPPR